MKVAINGFGRIGRLVFRLMNDDPNYSEAVRLMKILNIFLPIPSEAIPDDSILREFIGGSCF